MADLKKKNNKKVYFLIFIFFVIVLSIIIILLLLRNEEKSSVVETGLKPVSTENVLEKAEVKKENNEQKEEEIDTSDWQTYKSEKYGYSLKYPEEWEKNELFDNKYIGFKKNNSTIIELNILENKEKDNIEEWLNKQNKDYELIRKDRINNFESITVSEKVRMGDIPISTYIQKDIIMINISSVSGDEKDIKIFNKIIESIKFS